MQLNNIKFTEKDFEQSGWQDIIAETEDKECSSYSQCFAEKAKEMCKANNEISTEIYTVLHIITDVRLCLDSRDNPFQPAIITNGSRSGILDDLSENHIEVLLKIVSDTVDHEMRARIADVLWVITKNYHMAQIAIDAYLMSAKNLEYSKHWISCTRRLERALQLSAIISKKSNYYNKVIKNIQIILDKYKGTDPHFLSFTLMQLLIAYNIKKGQKKNAKYCEIAAIKSIKKKEWRRARLYLELQAQWHKKLGNVNKEKELKQKAADIYEKEADDAIKKQHSGYMAASSHLQKCIEAHRRAGTTKKKIKRLHKKLLVFQKKATQEMQRYSGEFNVRNITQDAIKKVENLNLQQALFSLCLITCPFSKSKLRSRVEKLAKKHPMLYMISSTPVNEKGKVIARRGSLLHGPEDEKEKAIEAEKFVELSRHIHLPVFAIIDPARNQIFREHWPKISDVFSIIRNSPIIPEGREVIFAQGLWAGLSGDFLTSAHFLIPQLENSLRNILNQHGVITSSLDSEGIQEEFDINKLLHMSECEEILGENTIFELRCLMIERFGFNMRNKFAHGLMNNDDFYSIPVIYFWWHMLRLCCFPIINHIKQFENTKK